MLGIHYIVTVCCLIVALRFELIVASNCQSSEDGFCRGKTLSEIGDINIAVPVSIHNPRDNKLCGDISVSGVQTALAVQWIVSILNGNNSGSHSFIPGVKLGYGVYDDCGLPSRTASYLTNIFHMTTLIDIDDCTTLINNVTSYAGILASTSPASSSTSLNIGLPDTPVITVNYFDNKFIQTSGAFFGVNSVQTEINAILKFMELYHWNFLAVVYTEDTTGAEYIEELLTQSPGLNNCYLQLSLNSSNADNVINNILTEQYSFAANETFGVLYLGNTKGAIELLIKIRDSHFTIASKLQLIFPSAVGTGLELRENLKQITNDIFLILPHRIIFDEFRNYFKSVIENYKNTEHSAMMTAYIQHICSHVSCGNVNDDIMNYFKQEVQVDRTIVAVVSFWTAVKKLHSTLCSGNPGVCDSLIKHIQDNSDFLLNSYFTAETLSSISNIFSSEGNYGFVDSNIMNTGNDLLNILYFKENKEEMIGNFSNGVLNMDTKVDVHESICKVGGPKCARCISSQELQFGYISGEVIMLGLFSIHQDAYTTSNDEDTFFKCGDFRSGTTTIVTVSAFLESVKTLSKEKGVNFGAIALDDCYNELNISDLVTELFSGRRVLTDPITKQPIDFSKVVAVVGALSSRVTQRIADIMSSLHIPMVSYGASARTLDDRIRYPYFLRTVPSDALQIDGMVKLLSKLNIHYVGAMYIDDAYGASGIEGMITEARANGICVYDSSSVTEDTSPNDFKEILKKNYYTGGVKVIATFSIDTVVQKMVGSSVLGDTSDEGLSNYAPIFVSSEGWGTAPNLANKESAGSLIFITDSSKQVNGAFRSHLQSLTASAKTENPWLYRFWEEHFKCYMPRSFEKMYNERCRMDSRLNSDTIENLISEQRNIHTEIAVSAIANAYLRVSSCNSCFTRNKTSASYWTKAIKDVVIPISDGTNFRPFKNDGNGNLGFTIYNIQKKSNSYSYEKVGTYNGTLMVQTQKLKFYDHITREIQLEPIQCPVNEHCQDVCQTSTSNVETSTAAAISKQGTSADILTIVLGTLAGILFLVVILLTVLVFKALRTKHSSNDEKHTSHPMEHLTVPVHHRSNRSLNGVYNEPYSVHSSLNDIRVAHHNKGFNSDNDSLKHPPPSNSSGIVAGSGSESAGSRVMYSDMSQTAMKSATGNRYLSFESSDGSNNSLKSLTRRVLQPQDNFASNESNDDKKETNLTYISANDLDIVDEDEDIVAKNNSFINEMETTEQEKLDLHSPASVALTPNETGNMIPPPAYPFNNQMMCSKRPQTLPGINPLLLSPQITNKGVNTDLTGPSPESNLYTNDMYLMPVSDSLPTYQQHLEQQKQFQMEHMLPNGKMCHSPSTTYNNVHFNGSRQNQNGTISTTVMSPAPETRRYNGLNIISPSSDLGSQSPSILYLSPAKKEALLNQLLLENSNYFLNQSSYNYTSPTSSGSSPQSNVTLSPNSRDFEKLTSANNTMSPSSSYGGQSPHVLYLSPAQKEALLNQLLLENPNYFKTQSNYNQTSPVSSFSSPQSNISLSPNNRDFKKSKSVNHPSKPSPQIIDRLPPNYVVEMDDNGEVMI